MKLLNHPILQFIIVMTLIYVIVAFLIYHSERRPKPLDLPIIWDIGSSMFTAIKSNGEKGSVELGFRSDGVVVWRAVANP